MPFLNKILRKFAKEKAVWFQKQDTKPDGTTYYKAANEEIRVRWEDKEQEVVAEDGRTVTSTAYVLTSSAVRRGDLLWYGTLAALRDLPTYPKTPSVGQGAREVLVVKRTPDLNAQQFLYEVYL